MRFASVILLLVAGGCGLVGLLRDECESAPAVTRSAVASDEPLSTVQLALRYLRETQLTADRDVVHQGDYAGDWPQCAALRRTGPWARDASPFMATFVHHALSQVTEETQDILAVTDADVADARAMRVAAVTLMDRFRAVPPALDAGTYGFWPAHADEWLPGNVLLSLVLLAKLQGPFLQGTRGPANISFIPAPFAIPSDADDTAAIYAALLDHERIDGGTPVTVSFEHFFSDWRDLGQVPRRNSASWLPERSGAFLTWLAYNDDPDDPQLNDVDPVVNANVLYTLGRYRRLDTPGVADAIDLVIAAAGSDTLVSDADAISLYYPDNLCFHYCVTRAYREGGVVELGPAVDALVADLLATVVITDEYTAYWDRGDPHLNTAFGALALLQANRHLDVAAAAIDYLVAAQDPADGSWEAGVFFRGRYDGGKETIWMSTALTTAMALEAVTRQQILRVPIAE